MSIRLPLLVAILSAALLAPAAAQAKASPAQQLYVSLGDSYATGFQPLPKKANTRNGFAYKVPAAARKRGYDLKLVNFGCAGATTTSVLKRVGCTTARRGPGGPAYNTSTQIAAAERFIRKNRKKVALISVSISGNDVTKCATATDVGGCVSDALVGINTNVATLVKRLRAVAGPKVKIVGITYPDVILGAWVTGGKGLAEASVSVFKQLINPALKKQYESVNGSFVDVTAATGAYGPLTETTTLAPYGVIPVPVAKICTLTYYCEVQDIHAKNAGYELIGGLVAKELPKKR